MAVKRREVSEAGGRVAAPTKLANGQHKLRARLIAGDIQGSSGYYPESVIERDGPRAFPKGTHMHLDHQSFMEMWTKPEGSIKDLAGVIASDPVYERNNPLGKGLYADVLLFSEYGDMLTELAPYIGLSIVAIASSEEGPSPETQELTEIVTEIIAGVRVDFVTFPGADGRITEIIEAHHSPTPESLGVPGAKEIHSDATPLTASESAGSNKEGEVNKVDEETAVKILAGIESMNTNFTALTTALTTEAAARQAKESGTSNDGEGKPDLATVIRTAVKALSESGLPQPAQDRVLDSVTAGKVTLTEAIAAEKAYIESLGVRPGNGSTGQSAGQNGSGGGFIADQSNGHSGSDGIDLGSQWWARESSVTAADAVVIKGDDLLVAFGG